MGIFEERGGADGDGFGDYLQIGDEVVAQPLREMRLEEAGEDFFVGGFAERQRIEFVRLHELVEDVGAEHHGAGEQHRGVVKTVEVGVTKDDVVEERQAAPFSAERTIADALEVAVLVKAVAIEDGDHTLVLHAPIAHDGVEDDLTVGVDVLEFVPGDVAEELGNGEKCSRAEPARDVVVANVVEEGFGGQGEDVVLQVLEVADAHLLAA